MEPGVLGVDVCSDRLAVVEVSSASGAPALMRCATAEVPHEAADNAVAAILQTTLDDGGFLGRSAVIGLGEEQGFVECRSVEHEQTAAGEPAYDKRYAVDGWRTDSGWIVRGVAQRDDVDRAMRIATQAGLQPLGVELRSMACLTALGLLEQREPSDSVLGIVLDASAVTLALVDGEVLRVVQSEAHRWRHAGEDSLLTINRLLRLAAMSGLVVRPKKALLIARAEDQGDLARIESVIGASVSTVHPGLAGGLDLRGVDMEDPAAYAASAGLALEAIAEQARKPGARRRENGRRPLNFMVESAAPARKMPTWLRATVAVGVVVLLVVGGLGLWAGITSGRLAELKDKHSRLLDPMHTSPQRLALWRAVRAWVPRAEGGRRLPVRPILKAVANAFPPTQHAFVSWMEVEQSEPGEAVVIRLRGRSRDTQVLYEFVSRLNAEDSPFEHAALGQVDVLSDESAYGNQFTVSFHVKS